LLLHGDILSQLGDFRGALVKFKLAAEGCGTYSKCSDSDDQSPSLTLSTDTATTTTASSITSSLPTSLPNGCPLPYVNAGRAYLAMNEHLLAEKHLLKALEIDPTCASCHLDLGQVRNRVHICITYIYIYIFFYHVSHTCFYLFLYFS
jgi:tetratricopeptide (TPR) repeat protein